MDLRLLRITRFYRAFPQLDRLTDEQCEELAIRARTERGDAAWMIPVGAGVLLAFVSAGVLYMLSLLTLTAAGAGGGGGKAPVAGSTAAANLKPLETVLFLGVAAGAIAVFFLVMILVHRVMIARTMIRLTRRGDCPFCDFSLVGLVVDRAKGGTVRCPECGRVVVLVEHRIREEDLIPDTPEGLRAMREHWKKQGADKYGALSGGKRDGAKVAEPKGKDLQRWQESDLKRKLDQTRARTRGGEAGGSGGGTGSGPKAKGPSS